MKTIIGIGLVLLVLCFSAQATSNTLDSAKGVYENKRQNALADYGKALDASFVSLKQAGDLDGVVIVRDEQRRFESEKVVLPASNGVFKAIYEARVAYQVSMISLMKKYVSFLDGLVKQLTKQDKIEEAKIAKVEKDRVAFELADAESVLPKSQQKTEISLPSISVLAVDIPVGLKNGLLLHYGFDKDESKVKDKSGNGNAAVANGTVWVKDGSVGGAYDFGGAASVSCNSFHQPGQTKEMSLSAWIRPSTDFDSQTGRKQISSHDSGSHQFQYDSGKLVVEIYDVSHGSHIFSHPVTLKKGKWYHVAFTAKVGGQVCLYIDGKGVVVGKLDIPIEDVAKPFNIGRCGNGSFFLGTIDEVMIWNRSLSDVEVKQLFSLPKSQGLRNEVVDVKTQESVVAVDGNDGSFNATVPTILDTLEINNLSSFRTKIADHKEEVTTKSAMEKGNYVNGEWVYPHGASGPKHKYKVIDDYGYRVSFSITSQRDGKIQAESGGVTSDVAVSVGKMIDGSIVIKNDTAPTSITFSMGGKILTRDIK